MSQVITVDTNDKILGSIDKNQAHQSKGILHRAISVLVFNKKNEILLQKRSKYKQLWPLFWSNTCCSHPYPNETYLQAGKRRLWEEMGIKSHLKPLFKFQYQVSYKEIGSENEMCQVFLGTYDGVVRPDKKEAADHRWLSLKQLKEEIKKKPEIFTPWFKQIISYKDFQII